MGGDDPMQIVYFDNSGFKESNVYIIYAALPESYCSGANCSTTDLDTCCDKRAKCNASVCNIENMPAGSPHFSFKPNATDLFCGGQSCGVEDLMTCCAKKESCTKVQCSGEGQMSSHFRWCASD